MLAILAVDASLVALRSGHAEISSCFSTYTMHTEVSSLHPHTITHSRKPCYPFLILHNMVS